MNTLSLLGIIAACTPVVVSSQTLNYDSLWNAGMAHHERALKFLNVGDKTRAFHEMDSSAEALLTCQMYGGVNRDSLMSTWKRFADEYPQSPLFLCLIATTEDDPGRSDSAIKKAILLEPDYRWPYLLLGVAQQNIGEYADAEVNLFSSEFRSAVARERVDSRPTIG